MTREGAAVTAEPTHQQGTARRVEARRAVRPPGRRGWRERVEILLFVTPALLLMAVFIAWPVITAVRMSFYRWRGFGPMDEFVGLRNFTSVLTDEVFTDAVGHNLTIVVLSILVQLPLGLGVALLLNRRIRGRGLLRTIIFVPYVVAEVIAGVIWFQLLQPGSGVVDGLISAVGLTPPDQGFLGTPSLTLWTVFVVLTWKYLGLAILLFLAGLQGIPDELYEAAELDGANRWQQFWHVTLPGIRPTLVFVVVISTMFSLLVFDYVWATTKGGPAGATEVVGTLLYREAFERFNVGYAAALGVSTAAVCGIVSLVYVVLRRRGWEV